MLTIRGNKHPFCDGISRREFLTVGGLAPGGLSHSKRTFPSRLLLLCAVGAAFSGPVRAQAQTAPAAPQQSAVGEEAQTPWYTVRVQVLRCSDDDGGRECDVTVQDVQQMVDLANSIYAKARIRFVCSPTQDYAPLRNTVINSLMPNDMRAPSEESAPGAGTEADQLRETRKIAARYPDKVTVFFRWGDNRNRPTGNGYGEQRYVAMPGLRATNMGLRGLSHELGHYFGLSHTFAQTFRSREEASEFLRTHDNNLAVFDGDGLRDTPPDPGVDIAFNNGVREVLLNGTRVALPTGNIMSYMNWDSHEWLSAAQAERVRANYRLRSRFGGIALPTNQGAEKPIEAERLPFETRGGVLTSEQSMKGFGTGLWSGDAQRFGQGRKGGSLLLRFPVPSAGAVHLRVYMTRAPDFAKLKFYLDNRPVGETFDGYAPSVTASGRISLGTVYLFAGTHTLRFEIVGKNEVSKDFAFGIDCLDLVRGDGAADRSD